MANFLFDGLHDEAKDSNDIFIQQPESRTFTYGDTWAISAQLANSITKLGVRAGDRVAVQTEKSAWTVMLYLACVRAGAVYLPLNTAYTLNELEYFIGDAEPTLVVTSSSRRDGLVQIAVPRGARVETLDVDGSGTLLDAAAIEPLDFSNVECEPETLAAILYTSGTTGRSKGAMLTHDNLLSNAMVLKDFWQFNSADRLIHALPIFHTHGLFVATNVVLASGASMYFLNTFDSDKIITAIPKSTVFMGVPTFYVRLLQNPALDRNLTANMRLFISGSAPLLSETHDAFLTRTGHPILERYGMTETNMNTSNPYTGQRKAGTVGQALPGVSIRIRNGETSEDVRPGEVGMIEVKGRNVFAGYWRMPEKTAAEFTGDGFFVTGDLGRVDEDNYIQIVGRGKDLIISGGFNVYPREVEAEIDALEGVEECAVIGVPHPDFGEGVTAVVVMKRGSVGNEKAAMAALSSKLAKFKQPKRIFFVGDLPRNAMGKVQKNLLREQYKAIFTDQK
jgi:malonyl-CoA/methylmalonyl-CoA synthetase